MLQRIYDWMDERLDITPIWRDLADHVFPNMSTRLPFFRVCVLFRRVDLFCGHDHDPLGHVLAMDYVPDIVNAHASVDYLQHQVAFGQIVRGMHHWGASVVIVMLLLHTLRVFFTGAYKKPRELNWVVGMLIFFHAGTRIYRVFAALGQQGVFRDESGR